MRFVMEAYRKTRRRTNLERWLLLVCRCLLVAALGIGLARPLVSGRGGEGQGGRTVWFVLDDGLIGQTMVEGKTDLARAVERCKSVLDTLGPGDRAGVVLAGVPARGVVSPPSGNLAGVRSTLDALTATDAPSDWAGAIGLAGEGIVNDRGGAGRGEAERGEDVIVVAQGGRVGTGRVGEPLTRLPARVRLVAAEPAQEGRGPVNVAVTGIKALRPVLITGGAGSEAAQTVTVSLRRFGEGVDRAGVSRVGVRLSGQDGATATGTVNWSAGQREGSLTLVVDAPRANAGQAQSGSTVVVVAELDGAGDAIAGDNTWRLPVVSREALRVGVLADASARGSIVSGGTADRFRPGQWIGFALRPSDSAAVDLVEIEPGAIDAARLSGLDAVIVLSPDAVPTGSGAANGWARLKTFVDQGGLVIVTPAFEATTQLWPEAMASGLNVGLAIGRAAKEYPADAPGRLVGGNAGELGAGDVLATLRGELDVLARPVGITRLLAPLERAADANESREETRVLMRTQDGAAFVTLVTRKGDAPGADRAGAVMYLSAALDLRWTDLPAKPLMVPLMQELVRQGVGRARPVYVSVAGSRAALPAGTASLKPVAKTDVGTVGVDSGGSGRTADAVRTAGAWFAIDGQGADRGVVAVNAPSEADTVPLSKDRVGSWLAGALPERGDAERAPEVEWADNAVWTKGLSAVGAGQGESRVGAGSLLLLAALVLALIEVVLARVASASSVRPKGVAHG